MIANIFQPNKSFDAPLIMGIINVTPDSFSDGGKYFNLEQSFSHAKMMIEKSVDIIDIGGESTRPGALSVSIEEEIARTIPLIKKIRGYDSAQLISIDTTKSEVAREAMRTGANLINDISGGLFDEKIFSVAAEYDAPIVINHIKGTPQTMQISPDYENVVNEILNYFDARIALAKRLGVGKIILDPGIGFGKLVEHNYEIISEIGTIKTLGYPVLVGLSRKTFLGGSLNLEISERDTATIIAETIAVMNGADIIRTHNIENARQMKMIFQNLKRQLIV